MSQSNKKQNFVHPVVLLYTTFIVTLFSSNNLSSQELPQIISDKGVYTKNYLPDFSYAG